MRAIGLSRAEMRLRVVISRTRSSRPWALLGCSRQPTVLKITTRTHSRTPKGKSDWSSAAIEEVSGCPFQDNKLSGTVN